MHKYIYLGQHSFQDAWIHGGDIPITAASTYLSDVRGGTLTPDENFVHESTHDLMNIPGVRFGPGVQIKNFSFTGNRGRNGPLPNILNASMYNENGAVLCMCDDLSDAIMRRFGKVCCVRVLDVHRLKSIIDAQVGVNGVMAPCEYTSDHRRNHFLKSDQDSWQKEYRIFWKDIPTTWVALPPGMAEAVVL